MTTEKISGRGWGNYLPGEKIQSIEELTIGGTYLEYSKQFNSKNIVKIIRKDESGMNRSLVYGTWVISNCKTEECFVIWDFDLNLDDFYHVVKFDPQDHFCKVVDLDKIKEVNNA